METNETKFGKWTRVDTGLSVCLICVFSLIVGPAYLRNGGIFKSDQVSQLVGGVSMTTIFLQLLYLGCKFVKTKPYKKCLNETKRNED